MKIEKYYNVCTNTGIYIDWEPISNIDKNKLKNIIIESLDNIDYESFFEHCIYSEEEETEKVQCEYCGTWFITTLNYEK